MANQTTSTNNTSAINYTKGASGKVTVVAMEKHLTYLTVGETYDYTSDGKFVRFYSQRGGTFEQVTMLRIFQRQGRIQFAAA